MLALVDTGAGLTVASSSLLPLLGISSLEAPSAPAAIGMAGIPVKFVWRANVELQIGRFTFAQPVYFTEGPCVPRRADVYNIILGNDLRQRLPRWSLNYAQNTLLVEGDPIPILTEKPACSVGEAGDAQEPFAVRAQSTTVLPPGHEMLVPCYVSSTEISPQLFFAHSTTGLQEHLLVAPAVLPAPTWYLMVSNPTQAPVVLYKDQLLTTTHDPVLETSSGSLIEDPSCF
ncbi:hypothetical protein Q1695_009235 [Nippostrongylus brasiliensis]|nr:hypothetical protein Q1695_009235 [Nippostrongylus brasiliensis]